MNPAPETLPAWYEPAHVILDLDVAALMATGEHPLERVQAVFAVSQPGQILALTSPFRPEPLLEVFRSAGAQVWCGPQGELHRTLIRKP